MRLFNLFIALLYLSLLVTTDTGNAHDQRLSPLADNQFQAVHYQQNSGNHSVSAADQEPDEPDSTSPVILLLSFVKAETSINTYTSPWLAFSSSPDTARAPPIV
ncbi:hypothetical protein [Alishewanella longhuensis]|uniref:Uncharacterized protein n=1 Tax=Alishewanella longhuensis TaxID=1091037 RepID=A0ABQ3L364_9ALTE|nr:hypothetical protein [Alishewanella longhuensis]GHG75267.1 hypothetical protein GCM10010919_29290 [Alishewanella longhuensis]